MAISLKNRMFSKKGIQSKTFSYEFSQFFPFYCMSISYFRQVDDWSCEKKHTLRKRQVSKPEGLQETVD